MYSIVLDKESLDVLKSIVICCLRVTKITKAISTADFLAKESRLPTINDWMKLRDQ